ncbi:MAG: hypothetical protein KJP13_06740 [Altererythrobacter sp.]|nr:hypothetical protein [Altererythrobacter sp.]
MLRLLIYIVALCSSSAVCAKDRPPIETQSAQMVEAISQGQFGSRFSDKIELSASEIAELSKFNGCTPQRRPTRSPWLVEFDWRCGEAKSHTGYAVATSWLFSQDSQLVGFTINPIIQDLRPLPAAAASESPESKSEFAKRFAAAVVGGDDFTLSGQLQFSEYEIERLADFVGGEYSVSIGGSNGVRSIKFWGNDNVLHRTLMYFDAAGRAVGLTFKPGAEIDSAGRRAASDLRTSRSGAEQYERLNRNRESERRSSNARDRSLTRQICPTC